MKKKVLSILLAGAMVMAMTACGGDSGNAQSSVASGGSAADVGNAGGELVDGRFAETRTITVEVYNRENDGGSDPTNNMYTEYIKQGMLADHNVQVEFVSVPRWTEVEQINNLLAAGDAPDICVTYDYPTIQTYANMGGVIDRAPYIAGDKDALPNSWNWLGAGAYTHLPLPTPTYV